nr:MAG TPA: hypothetical protein [Caudoviricetes sp.]
MLNTPETAASAPTEWIFCVYRFHCSLLEPITKFTPMVGCASP